jgi:hypothetical protein
MVQLQRAMSLVHQAIADKALVYVSAARFDQQTTTRLHRDGGPEESFLMLGYEPSAVASELQIADYARCAFDLGLSPKEFLVRHNPMFQAGHELLMPYTTRIPCFSRTNYQIAFINNSCAPYSEARAAWQGTLHTATIVNPDDAQRRVINSTMLASVPKGSPENLSPAELDEFVHTWAVRRQGYDKHHLKDDP